MTEQEQQSLREIRRELMEKNNPTRMQQMSQAVQRIRSGHPTADDYRLILEYPSMAAMFMRSKSHEI